LEWSKDDEHLDLQIKDSLEDRLEGESDDTTKDGVDGRSKDNMTKSEAARKLWEESEDLSQSEAGEVFGVSDAAVAKAG